MSQRFIFRLAVVLLILVGMLAPPRLVFACQAEGHRQYACCCHKKESPCRSGGCHHQAKAQQASCCEVFQETEAEAQASPAGQIFKLIFLAPPATIVRIVAQAIPDLSLVFPSRYPVWLSGSQTYLTTLRLRI
ncbi:MAG: hypothetical protein ACK4JF_02915 [Methylohalobius sp.]